MPTTKKVASNSKSDKPTSNRTAKKATPKKVVSKSPSKTTKKSTSKKTTAKKKKTSETFENRLAKVEIFHNKKLASKKVAPLKTSKAYLDSAKNSSSSLSLTVLSPYRFPIQLDVVAINVARFSGIAMVILGGIFSFFHFSQLPQVLSAIESVPHIANTCGAATCTQAITQPPVSFSTPGNPLTSTINVTLNVENANSVKVLAYSHPDGQTLVLGHATKQNANTWKYSWDTSKYLNGDYVLEALVTNQYGSYSTQSWVTSVVLNSNPIAGGSTTTGSGEGNGNTASSTAGSGSTNTQNSSNDSSSTNNSNTQTTSNVESSSLKTVYDSNKNKLDIEVTGSEINRVNTYLAKPGETAKYLGRAYDRGDGVWRYTLDTFNYQAGEYKISAHVTYVNGTTKNLEPKIVNFKSPVATTVSSTTNTDSVTNPNKDSVLQPEVSILIPNSMKASGVTDVLVKVDHAQAIELYVISKQSLRTEFLGTARKLTASEWVFRFDTENKPNGSYEVYASVKNQYGAYSSKRFSVVVQNVFTLKPTLEQVEKIEVLNSIKKDIETDTVTTRNLDTKIALTNGSNDTDDDISEDSSEVNKGEESDSKQVEGLYKRYEQELQRLASAIRNGDKEAIEQTKQRLAKLRQDANDVGFDETSLDKFVGIIDSAFDEVSKEVARTNKIIAERTAEAASKDSDKDGIPDFDEVTIFGTDPFSADTDKDGFNDGAEILNGYDPLDAKPQVSVNFESPKEKGIVREDILEVTEIVKGKASTTIGETFITGKALPNSFATLYIFSTPVVVTVKTESDGSFIYRFDKELDDGEHEIYVGVTDNAGRIVAKSNPLRFVKEAQAFTPVDAAGIEVVTETVDTSIVNQKVILIALSFSVVAIGVVLIMVGMHLEARPRKIVTGKELVNKSV